jgi:glycosyltransferase involved in cell wall biosynthesis
MSRPAPRVRAQSRSAQPSHLGTRGPDQPFGPRNAPSRVPSSGATLISRTAFISTYAPRRCGVASFTYDLGTTIGEREIVALHPPGEPGPYPAEVRHRVRRDERGDYGHVAESLNACGVDVVSLQYEPSIWGGRGAYVLDFIRGLRIPLVVTLHDLPAHPSPEERDVVREMVDTAATTVVMSEAAATRLAGVYGVTASTVEFVPYGIASLPLVAPDTIKPRLGLKDRTVILSFGLLAPGKGFETMIEAMPEIVAACPSARYTILGSTSPDAPEAEGDAYRAALQAQVTAMGLADHVQFVDRFVGRVELGTWLEAADVFVAPAPELERTVSGTLAYAMGAGKAVVSTPSHYATEMLAEGRGRLVAPSSPAELAGAVIDLLNDPAARAAMGKRAYEHTRGMVWWEVGRRYRAIFDRAAGTIVNPAGSSRRTPTSIAR